MEDYWKNAWVMEWLSLPGGNAFQQILNVYRTIFVTIPLHFSLKNKIFYLKQPSKTAFRPKLD